MGHFGAHLAVKYVTFDIFSRNYLATVDVELQGEHLSLFSRSLMHPLSFDFDRRVLSRESPRICLRINLILSETIEFLLKLNTSAADSVRRFLGFHANVSQSRDGSVDVAV